ncbi:MAG: 4Fe-4S binding protein [Armatimonadota bacterium]
MRRIPLQAFLFVALAAPGLAVENYPAPEFTQGYQFPEIQTPRPRAQVFSYVDAAVLIAALGLAAYLSLKKRSRRDTVVLVVFSVLYFGFFRRGCICAIGAIQNVALAACSSDYALPAAAGAFFLLPLLFALFFGRVFCAAVCPLGAAQEVVLLRPVQVPAWLDNALGTVPYIYLGAAVLFAATGSAFLICQYDPFILFFRLGGSMGMLLFGVAMLLVATTVGRPYCRYLCPYGVLLSLLSPFAKWQVSISPAGCRNCRQCANACPYGAIKAPTPEPETGGRTEGKGRLAALVVLLPILVLLGGWLVGLSSPVLAQVHPQVRLAGRVWLEEQGRVEGKTPQSEAFEALGLPSVDLYREAAGIRSTFDIGSWILGAWIGLVFGLRTIALSIPRHRLHYEADPAACVACCRCYDVCPVGRTDRSARARAQREERR